MRALITHVQRNERAVGVEDGRVARSMRQQGSPLHNSSLSGSIHSGGDHGLLLATMPDHHWPRNAGHDTAAHMPGEGGGCCPRLQQDSEDPDGDDCSLASLLLCVTRLPPLPAADIHMLMETHAPVVLLPWPSSATGDLSADLVELLVPPLSASSNAEADGACAAVEHIQQLGDLRRVGNRPCPIGCWRTRTRDQLA